MIRTAIVFAIIFRAFVCHSQVDTSKKIYVGPDTTSLLPHGKYSTVSNLIFGGYVSTYYAWYSDKTQNDGFVQFPAVAPRNEQFGLNMALISAKYSSENVRGNLGIHFGDIPTSIWPEDLNMIQEANAGARLFKGLWLDAGFFKSHVGVESSQPRENIATSIALPDHFEPYFFAGAKLTYVFSPKFSFQLNAFNSFNTLVDKNSKKVFGTSIVFDPNENCSITYNFLTGDESPDSTRIKQQRFYNDIYAKIQFGKFTLGLEANYGWQNNSKLKDSTQNAVVFSSVIVGKYQFIKQLAAYARGEYLSDPDRMLTGNIAFGNYVYGGTFGIEFKPFTGIVLSAEGRLLNSDNMIFRQDNFNLNQRYEIIGCIDFSF